MLFVSPPILGLRGKNVAGQFLSSVSLNDLLSDFLQSLLYLTQLVCLTLGVSLIVHFLNLAFVETVQFPFLHSKWDSPLQNDPIPYTYNNKFYPYSC